MANEFTKKLINIPTNNITDIAVVDKEEAIQKTVELIYNQTGYKLTDEEISSSINVCIDKDIKGAYYQDMGISYRFFIKRKDGTYSKKFIFVFWGYWMIQAF